MSVVSIVLVIIQLILALVLIAVVLIQTGKSAGLSGAIAGGSDTYLAKNKSRTRDAMLARWTKWIAAVFIILTLVLNIVL